MILNDDYTMIMLRPFQQSDFSKLISWIDNEELLVTIAGNIFTYPLTTAQLQKYLEDERSISFCIEQQNSNTSVGHAEIILANDGTCKIDKLLIADNSNRGKGVGQQVMKELLKYAFERLPVHTVELNVFDWNKAAICCYQKVGFVFNEAKTANFQVGNKNWTALNMVLHRSEWDSHKSSC